MELNISTGNLAAWVKNVVNWAKRLFVTAQAGDVWLIKLGKQSDYSSSTTLWENSINPYLVVHIDSNTITLARPEEPKRLIYKERKYVKLLTKIG